MKGLSIWDRDKMKACKFCFKIIYMYQVRGRKWSEVNYCDEHCAYEGRILETRITKLKQNAKNKISVHSEGVNK